MSFKSIQPKAFEQSPPVIDSVAVQHLSRAIQFKTIAHKIGMMDVEEINGLLQYIENTYPTFHASTTKEIVSTHTLFYTWEGSEPDLKPVLYMGHMDVVPVERATKDQWDFQPFSGAVEEGYINGRGALDDKGTVIGILEAAEMLAQEGFKPRRTIHFLFGQDEEIGGEEGSKIVADRFRSEGHELAMIWDEGTILSRGIVPGMDTEVALIGVAEKGYVSFDLICKMEGGHSSMPKAESAIGNLTRAIHAIQKKSFPYRISKPVEGFMDYIGPESPFTTKLAFSNRWLFKPLIFQTYASSGAGRAMIQSSMSPTIIQAGIKDNVIPSKAQAVVNIRILPGETVESVQQYLTKVVNDSSIIIKPQEIQQNPSESSDYNNAYFRTLGSAVKTVYPNANSCPSLMLGATDSRHFDGLCKNIYKFAPFVYAPEDLPRLHGINERIAVDNFFKGIQIYYLAIKNIDTIE